MYYINIHGLDFELEEDMGNYFYFDHILGSHFSTFICHTSHVLHIPGELLIQ